LQDYNGQPADALVISRLTIHPYSLTWRGNVSVQAAGGRFTLAGLTPNESYKVHFLDGKHRTGATADLKVGDDVPQIVLMPCAEGQARFVNDKNRPVSGYRPSIQLVITPGSDPYDAAAARRGEMVADADYVSNIDRINYSFGSDATDAEGRITFPALIPGATYRIPLKTKDGVSTVKEFEVNGSQTIDLGDLVVDGND
jgi:hypothetical protein